MEKKNRRRVSILPPPEKIYKEAHRLTRARNVRVLVHELRAVVDLVVDHNVDILFGVVLGNVLVGKLESGRHGGRVAQGREGGGEVN